MVPPAGAGPSNTAAPVKRAGDELSGLSVMARSAGASTLSVADCVPPLTVALITTATDCVVGVQRARRTAAEVAPAGTAREAGTDTTAGILLLSWTVSPAAGAGAVRVTCPVTS